MNDFFWISGHLGWGFFSIVVFTVVWLLLSDLYWRLKRTNFTKLLVTIITGWIMAIAIILFSCNVITI